MQETDQYFRAHVFCCSNQRPPGHARGCCADKNAEALRNHLKRRAKELGLGDVRINNAGCLDRCALGPVMVVYPDGVWYRALTIADIEEIVTQHLQHGKPVARLMLSNARAAE